MADPNRPVPHPPARHAAARPRLLQDMQRPLYMQPKDALEYGVIDGIVTPEKKARGRCGEGREGHGARVHVAATARGRPSLERRPRHIAGLARAAQPCCLPALSCPRRKQIIDDVKSADQWDKEAGLVAR